MKLNSRSSLCIALVSFLTLSTGFANEEEPGSAQLTLDDLRTFTDAFNQIRLNYVESIDDQTLLNAAIRGMLSELDPHSNFLIQDEFRSLDDTAKGRYGGVGVQVRIENQRIYISDVQPGGPADQAGIKAGDMVVGIEGKPVRGQPLRPAVSKLRGEVGTDIKLEVVTDDEPARMVTLVRDFIPLPSTESRLLEERYAYIRLQRFQRNSADEVRADLEMLREEAEQPLAGLILDLRDNPGGVLQPAITMADDFLEDGLIVSTRGRSVSQQSEFRAVGGDILHNAPIVILVDQGTASASEVLAGALQDHGRALVAGQPTFGKGSVQSVLKLRNGNAIKLTTARYYTPSGRSIQLDGIQPDVILEALQPSEQNNNQLREVDLTGRLDNDREDGTEDEEDAERNTTTVAATEDSIVDQALSLLKDSDQLSDHQTVPSNLHAQRPVDNPVDIEQSQ